MKGWVVAFRLTGLGWYIAFCIVLGIAAGVGLDNWLNTSPLFIILGTLLGSVVAFWGLYKMIRPLLYGNPSAQDKTHQHKEP